MVVEMTVFNQSTRVGSNEVDSAMLLATMHFELSGITLRYEFNFDIVVSDIPRK